MAEKKFYWLKMDKDFFDRHDVKILESYSKEYVLFYIKLMCESVSHDGNLRFSDDVPYTWEMLSIVTDTHMDIVEGAMDVLQNLGMIRYEDDGTYVISKVQDMIGTASGNDNAVRQQRYRDKQKALKNEESNADVTDSNVTRNVTRNADSNASITDSVTNSNESKSKSKSKSKESEIENIGYLNTLHFSEAVDRNAASAAAQITELYPVMVEKIIDIWNAREVTQNIKTLPVMDKRGNDTRLCFRYVDSFDDFLDVIRSLDEQAWFQKQAMNGKKLSYDWFCNPNNFLKIIEGNYKDDRTKESAYADWEE